MITAELYAVDVAPAAERDLRRLDPHATARLNALLSALAIDPRPPEATRLAPQAPFWRLSVWDAHVVYSVDPLARRISVWLVAGTNSHTPR